MFEITRPGSVMLGDIDRVLGRDTSFDAAVREFLGAPSATAASLLPLDISDSARLFAGVNTAIADAIGTVWNSKLRYMWWRPITAIREVPFSDGDAATVPVPGWLPLINTPPYPDWPSGLCAVVAAMTASLEGLTGGVDLTIVSPSQGARTTSAWC